MPKGRVRTSRGTDSKLWTEFGNGAQTIFRDQIFDREIEIPVLSNRLGADHRLFQSAVGGLV